jgi:hypothetical protein
MRQNYYVYLHLDKVGKIFYVGKGTAKRAWSKDRHPVWLKYVNERLNGDYIVEIFKDRLTEEDALEVEDQLIAEYGKQLVNWTNPGRNFDYQALEEFHRKRDANRAFVEETKKIEATDPTSAIERYLTALDRMREYESLTLETGHVAELRVRADRGDPNILNRLTICLQKLNRYSEMFEQAEKYFEDFPSSKEISIGKQIVKRIKKSRDKLEKTKA